MNRNQKYRHKINCSRILNSQFFNPKVEVTKNHIKATSGLTTVVLKKIWIEEPVEINGMSFNLPVKQELKLKVYYDEEEAKFPEQLERHLYEWWSTLWDNSSR